MNFRRTKVCAGVLAALGGMGGIGTALAQDAGQRIEITGSAIKRTEAEGAVPVLVLKKEDIAKTGATSTVDLLQRLPSVQGGTVEANSVGGSTFGFSGVSIHNVGETRTLVLLNGHRLSAFGGQTLTGFAAGFDLNSIPVSAIERVEVLTDGASALYGADAIAGVVNFITRRNTTEGEATIGTSRPKGGATENRFSFTKGFGSLESDGYNLMLSYAHDKRSQLKAVDRDYAKTGNLVFQLNGKTYRSQNYSASAIAANVLDNAGNTISPYLIANGSCPVNTFRVTDGDSDFCGFDFVSTLEIYPERQRDSGFASLTTKVADQEVFADLLLSRSKQVSRIAPVPGGLSLPSTSTYYQQYLAPLGITIPTTTAFYRVADLGPRTNEDTSDFYDLSVGMRGVLAGWDYQAALATSKSKVKGEISGYPGALALANLRRSGLLNPFVLTGQQSPEAQAALNAVNYKGYWDGGDAKLDSVSVQGSREIATLPGGPAMLALGAQHRKETFESKPSPFAQGITTNPVTGELCDGTTAKPCDQRFGDASAVVPYTASRNSYGIFGELNLPIAKGFETSFALRYDSYSDFGSTTTAKGSFRFLPTSGVLLRGSFGTGFHAPSVPQVNAAPQSYGVTEDPYECSAELAAIAASLGAVCQPGKRQYDVLAGGNKDLKPERSKNATFGIRLEPTSGLSAGADVWWVAIKDAFGQLSEQTVFANPSKGAWTTATDVGTGVTYLAWNAGNLNLGNYYSSGIDFDVSGRFGTPLGQVQSQFTATYMLRQAYQQEKGGIYYSDLADNTQGSLLYRWKGNFTNSITMGSFTHTAAINFVSGYHDALTTVEVLDSAGNVTGTEDIRLKAKSYVTLDWQSRWAVTKMFDVTVGVLNLFDKKPPFVLTTTGGQQVGYDANLYDSRGRTIYGNLTLKF